MGRKLGHRWNEWSSPSHTHDPELITNEAKSLLGWSGEGLVEAYGGEVERQQHFNRGKRERGHSRGRSGRGRGAEAKMQKTFPETGFSRAVGDEALGEAVESMPASLGAQQGRC